MKATFLPLILLIPLLNLGCSRTRIPDTLWIGHVAPLSGPGIEIGEETVQTLGSMVRLSQETGGLIGDRPMAIRHVDTGPQRKGRSAAVRLLALHRVLALLVGPGVEDVEDILALGRSEGVPVVVINRDVGAEGRSLAGFLLSSWKAPRVVMGRDSVTGMMPRAQAFRAVLRSREVMLREVTLSGDARADADSLREGGEEQVVLDVPSAELTSLVESLAGGERRPLAIWWTGEGPLPTRLPLVPPVYAARDYLDESSLTPEAKAVAKEFKERYPLPWSDNTVRSLDALGVVERAMRDPSWELGKKSLPSVMEDNKTYQGLTGDLRLIQGRWERPVFVVRYFKEGWKVEKRVSATGE